MRKQIEPFLWVISIVVILLFVLFVVNQTSQAVQLASTVSPSFGRIVLYVLLALYTSLVAVLVVAIVRLPPALRPPEDETSRECGAYLRQLGRRLVQNPHLAGAEADLSERAGSSGLRHLPYSSARQSPRAASSTR